MSHVSIRDCFNTDRDHDDNAEALVASMDAASYEAGYALDEYAAALEAMADALRDRAQRVRGEAGSRSRPRTKRRPRP